MDAQKKKHTIIDQHQLLLLEEMDERMGILIERLTLMITTPQTDAADFLNGIRAVQKIRKEMSSWVRDRKNEMSLLR